MSKRIKGEFGKTRGRYWTDVSRLLINADVLSSRKFGDKCCRFGGLLKWKEVVEDSAIYLLLNNYQIAIV